MPRPSRLRSAAHISHARRWRVILDWLKAFGLFAVTMMLVTYA